MMEEEAGTMLPQKTSLSSLRSTVLKLILLMRVGYMSPALDTNGEMINLIFITPVILVKDGSVLIKESIEVTSLE